jgi:hypothetical protein
VTTVEQVRLFRGLFTGRTDAYGTYDPGSGRVWQVKAPITDEVVHAHLTGRQPLGLYLLLKDTVWASVVDFDVDEAGPPAEFVGRLRDLGLPGYIERSKSKGYHVWVFFSQQGVKASSARRVLNGVLARMGRRSVEVFPKQDCLDTNTFYGNFINLPLFGRLVASQRTVFVDANLSPFPDQWSFLAGVQRATTEALDGACRKLGEQATHASPAPAPDRVRGSATVASVTFALRPCARRMLTEGVTANQRTACFRLAVQLRKAGLPFDYAILVLTEWARKNRPADGRGILSRGEIVGQAQFAYREGRQYRGCGCDDETVRLYCDPACSLHKRARG